MTIKEEPLAGQRRWADDTARWKFGLMARQTGKDFCSADEGVRDGFLHVNNRGVSLRRTLTRLPLHSAFGIQQCFWSFVLGHSSFPLLLSRLDADS